MLLMFFRVLRKDEDIVEVDYTEHVNKATQRSANVGLEGGGGIRQTKGHHEIFVVPVSRTEGCLPLVSFSYADPMVGVSEVDLREHCRASEAIQKLVDER